MLLKTHSLTRLVAIGILSISTVVGATFDINSAAMAQSFEVQTRTHCERCKLAFGVTRPCRCRCQTRVCGKNGCQPWKDSGKPLGLCG